MKILAFLMAFMVLAQSLLPCADTDALGNGSVKTELKSSTQNNDTQPDDCSPFCQCPCCAGFSINHTIASFSTLSLVAPSSVPAFLPSETREIALPIWQPPN